MHIYEVTLSLSKGEREYLNHSGLLFDAPSLRSVGLRMTLVGYSTQ